MEGLNFTDDLKRFEHPASEKYHIEKDLNAPIDLNNIPEPAEMKQPEHSVNRQEQFNQRDLNRPIGLDNDEGLTNSQKAELKEQTGWSDEVIECINTKAEAEVYLDASLKEVNGNLERTDIDWNAKIPPEKIDRMRSLYGDQVADKWADKTNMDLIKEGKAPYGYDGERINLHHIGQKADSPLAELTDTEHKQNDGILHDKSKSSEIERPVFRTERQNHWQSRYESLQN